MASATAGSILDIEKYFAVSEFIAYALDKKVRFDPEQVNEVLEGISNVDYPVFVNLMVLASCGGVESKLGVNNFSKLMEHLGIANKPAELGDEFDSGRDDSSN